MKSLTAAVLLICTFTVVGAGIGTSCTRKGNLYTVVPGSNCTAFTQRDLKTNKTDKLYCPAHLQFNVAVCVCDYSYRTKCASFTPSSSSTCYQKGNEYKIIPGTNCRRFSQRNVFTNVSGTHQCPGNLQFNVRPCVCDYPYRTRCAQPLAIQMMPQLPAGSSSSCTRKGNLYTIVPGSDCTAFTQRDLKTNKTDRVYCPANLQFNVAVCVCDYRNRTKCANPGPSPTSSTTCYQRGNEYKIVPGTNCRRFTQRNVYTNVSGTFMCSSNLQFNVKPCVCDFPNRTTCAKPLTNQIMPRVPTGRASSCIRKGNLYTIVPDSDCTAFTQRDLKTNKTDKLYCPSNLQFNVAVCVCDYRNRTKCANPGPSPSSSTTCYEKGNEYKIVTGTNCRWFTQRNVFTNVSGTHLCPKNLQFNVRPCVCDYPSRTTCARPLTNQKFSRNGEAEDKEFLRCLKKCIETSVIGKVRDCHGNAGCMIEQQRLKELVCSGTCINQQQYPGETPSENYAPHASYMQRARKSRFGHL